MLRFSSPSAIECTVAAKHEKKFLKQRSFGSTFTEEENLAMRFGVLFVSPHREDATALSRMLESILVPLEHVADFQHACEAIRKDPFQVVLTEANLPDGNWRDVLALAQQVTPESEVIVTDRMADARFWAEALNLGAYDFLAQPFATSEVQRILHNACSHQAVRNVAHARC
jgi:DNA-binding NtrC family response regulator